MKQDVDVLINLTDAKFLMKQLASELKDGKYRKATRTSNALLDAIIHIKEVCIYRREDEHTNPYLSASSMPR